MFRQLRDINSPTGEIDPNRILYTDEQGVEWFIVPGTRYWNQIYLPWLAEGNTPDPVQ